MSLPFQPIALARGECDKVLHLWDPDCEPESFDGEEETIQCECQWGAGLIEKEAALILYVFDERKTIEIYFPQKVAAGPHREMNSWDVLLSYQPETLILAYGETPKDRRSRVKVTCREGESMMESLDFFLGQLTELNEEESRDPVVQQLTAYINNLEAETTVESKG